MSIVMCTAVDVMTKAVVMGAPTVLIPLTILT